jgi:DNA-binding NarL/FixJ family response regulator
VSTLTPRQREVAVGLASGMTNGEVADAIGCSVKTIDSHRQSILKKLKLRNNVELTHWAIATGLVQLRCTDPVLTPSDMPEADGYSRRP